MGHNIEYYEYPESVDKNKVYSELGTMVYYRCIQEGGRLSAIRWLESSAPILNGRAAAEEYIKAYDKGWYDCLAVRFHPQSTKESEREKTRKSSSISSIIDWRSRSLLRIFRVQKPTLSVAKAAVLEFLRRICLQRGEPLQTNALYVDVTCGRRPCLQRRRKSEKICRNAAMSSSKNRKSVRSFVKCAGL